MRIIARFAGPNGEIRILEERGNGARSYYEGGVYQSEVRAGGETGIDYVRLMADLLAGGGTALLLGCGGGSLGGMLHRRGSSVTVVDINPLSFQLARTFFWMPSGIECVTIDMRDFVRTETRRFDAHGHRRRRPSFLLREGSAAATVGCIRRLLRDGGRITINISCETDDDPVSRPDCRALRRRGIGGVAVQGGHEPAGGERHHPGVRASETPMPVAVAGRCELASSPSCSPNARLAPRRANGR